MKYPPQTTWDDIPKTRIVCATSDDRKQEYVLYICHHITGDERMYLWEDIKVVKPKPNCHWACTGCNSCGSIGSNGGWF